MKPEFIILFLVFSISTTTDQEIITELKDLCIPLSQFQKENNERLDNKSLYDFFYSHDVIGKGKPAEVIKLEWKEKLAVIKKINIVKNNLVTEIIILKETSGKNFFTEFYDCTYSEEENPTVYLFFEQLVGELDEISRKKFLVLNSPKERLEIYKQFAEALITLHNMGFIHGDIKPDNIMMADESYKNLKLIDFGLTSKIGLNCLGGSPLTNSPEKQKYLFSAANKEMDIFAFGMTLAILEIGLSRIMDIFRKSFGFNVQQVLMAMRNKAIREVQRINPFGSSKPNIFIRFWDFIKSFFIDNSIERIYDFSDLVENNMEIDAKNRLGMETIIKVLDKFIRECKKTITNESQYIDPNIDDPYAVDIKKALLTSINKDNYEETLQKIEYLMRLESRLHPRSIADRIIL